MFILKIQDDMKLKAHMKDSHMELVPRWALLSTKKVKIDHFKPLPANVINLLVENESKFSTLWEK